MNEKDVIVNLFMYNADVRKKYLDAMEDIEWSEIEKNRESSFHSIKGVFLHVLSAYDWWIEYAYRDRLGEFRRPEPGTFSSLQSLREKEREVGAVVMGFVNQIEPERLDERFTYHGKEKAYSLTIRDMLLHLVEEELQHRGEINCMFWQMNKDPPVTGYDDWTEEQ